MDIKVNGNIFVHHLVFGCIQHAYNYMLQDCSPPSLVFWKLLLRKVEPGEVKILSLSAELGLNLASPGVLGCQQNFFNIYFIYKKTQMLN